MAMHSKPRKPELGKRHITGVQEAWTIRDKALQDINKRLLRPGGLWRLVTKKPSLNKLMEYLEKTYPDISQSDLMLVAQDIQKKAGALPKQAAPKAPEKPKPVEAAKPGGAQKPAPPVAEKKPIPEKAPAEIRRTVVQATVEQILGDVRAGKFKPSSLKGKRLVNDLVSYFKKTYPYQYQKILSKEEFRAALKGAVPRVPSVIKQAVPAAAPVPVKPVEAAKPKQVTAPEKPAEAARPAPKGLLPAEAGKSKPIPRELALVKWEKPVEPEKPARVIRPIRQVLKPKPGRMTADTLTTRLVSDYEAGYFRPSSLGAKPLVREIRKYFAMAYPLVSVSGKNFKTAAINFKEIASVLPRPARPGKAEPGQKPIALTPERRSELVGIGDEAVRSLRTVFRRPALRERRLARAETFSKEEVNRVVRGVLEKRGLTGKLSKEEFGFISDYASKRPKGKGWAPRPPTGKKFRYEDWLEKSLAETLASEAIERKWNAEQKALAEESRNVLAELEREGRLKDYLVTGKLKYPLPAEAKLALDRALRGYLERIGDDVLRIMVKSPKFGGKIPQISGLAPKPGGKEFSEDELKGFTRIALERQGLKGQLNRDYFKYILRYVAEKAAPLPTEVTGAMLTPEKLAKTRRDYKRAAEAFRKISSRSGVSKEELDRARASYQTALDAFKEMRARIAAKAPKVGATKEAREAYAKAAKAFEEQLKIKAEREKKKVEEKKKIITAEREKAKPTEEAKPKPKKGFLAWVRGFSLARLAGLGAIGGAFAIALAIGLASTTLAKRFATPVEAVSQTPIIIQETVSSVPNVLFANPALLILILIGALIFLFAGKKKEE